MQVPLAGLIVTPVDSVTVATPVVLRVLVGPDIGTTRRRAIADAAGGPPSASSGPTYIAPAGPTYIAPSSPTYVAPSSPTYVAPSGPTYVAPTDSGTAPLSPVVDLSPAAASTTRRPRGARPASEVVPTGRRRRGTTDQKHAGNDGCCPKNG